MNDPALPVAKVQIRSLCLGVLVVRKNRTTKTPRHHFCPRTCLRQGVKRWFSCSQGLWERSAGLQPASDDFPCPASFSLDDPALPVAKRSTLEHKYCNVCRRGLRGEIKAGGGSRCLCIFDDDQRRDRSQSPSALRVATGRADFFVAPPPLWQGMAFVVASRTRPVALATNVAVFMSQCTKLKLNLRRVRCITSRVVLIEQDVGAESFLRLL